MSKLAHSHQPTMDAIDRKRAAEETPGLERCRNCDLPLHDDEVECGFCEWCTDDSDYRRDPVNQPENIR